MAKILVVDSERSVRNTLKDRLEYEGYNVIAAEGVDEAIQMNEKIPFDAVLCDIKLYDIPETEALERIRERIPVIVLSEDRNIDTVVRTIREGAYDYITKPIDMNRLRASLHHALEEGTGRAPQQSGSSNTNPKPQRRRNSGTEDIIGESMQIMHIKKIIDKVAPSEARVLITGANGTGKELVARWLHEKSTRCGGPFVEVNCAAIPSELIESELFGHEKGAFTSAIKQRKGKFEQANGGTLFLDEVGDMSLSAQSKVLRALQENKVSRVGSDNDVDVNVRIVAATNKNLFEEIQRGNFREDLYHRLSVILITVPSLSERRDDIPLLTNHFIEKVCYEYDIPKKGIEKDAIQELQSLRWSGNIRELRNVIERLIVLSGNSISLEDVRTYALGVV